MFGSPRATLAVLVALALTAAPARAQVADSSDVAAVAPSPQPALQPPLAEGVAAVAPRPAADLGPTMDAAGVGARPYAAAHSADDEALASMRRRSQVSHSEALMIVGGAAFVAGALIGGDAGTIVMVGGAGVGLYGLYLYLQ